MLWETFEVYYLATSHELSTYHVAGIPPLTEANREKATHQEMINSMKR